MIVIAADMADVRSAAAIRLQAFARGVVARQRVRAIVHSMFEKVYDDSTGTFYYFNAVSGESSCEQCRFCEPDQVEPNCSDASDDYSLPRLQSDLDLC